MRWIITVVVAGKEQNSRPTDQTTPRQADGQSDSTSMTTLSACATSPTVCPIVEACQRATRQQKVRG